MIFVPLIYFTALVFTSRTPPIIAGLNLSWIQTIIYATGYITLEPVAGLLYAPILTFEAIVANQLAALASQQHSASFTNIMPICVGLHVLSWIAQFYGHGVHEKRSPALVDNLVQALYLAPLFVWLELLFALGYRKDLKDHINDEVQNDKVLRKVK
jgi:uncharacterized membrane protein YGL010W